MAPRNSRERLEHFMDALRHHLVGCYECRAALNSSDPYGMCRDGALFTVSAAKEFNNVIELRRKAHARGADMIFACPDLSKHGKAYELTATLFTVSALQDELF